MATPPPAASAAVVTSFYHAWRSSAWRFKVYGAALRLKKNKPGPGITAKAGDLNKTEMLAALTSWDSKIFFEEGVLTEAIYRSARAYEDVREAAAAADAAAASAAAASAAKVAADAA
ncbi:hypothetical protein M885DRAFT_573677, partial [Pelagophyceae sp. CCMP2097]